MNETRIASIGRYLGYVSDLPDTMDHAIVDGFDFVVTQVINSPQPNQDTLLPNEHLSKFTQPDFVLSSNRWTSCVVGEISSWLQLDQRDNKLRVGHEKVFQQEMAYAAHLGLPAVLVPTPTGRSFNYARILNEAISTYAQSSVWVKVPLTYEHDSSKFEALAEGPESSASASHFDSNQFGDEDIGADVTPRDVGALRETNLSNLHSSGYTFTTPEAVNTAETTGNPLDRRPEHDPWEGWNTLRSICESNSRLGVCLELTGDMPEEAVLSKWLGEPVKVVLIDSSIFLTNTKGFPVLSRAHQSFVQRLHMKGAQFLLRGQPQGPSKSSGGIRVYVDYLQHIIGRLPPMSDQERFERPYYDYLQSPLQPLMDHLESSTYETFEKDPIKYQQYELAIKRALDDTPSDKTSVVMVVGAGRGPLVRRALRAADAANRTIRVYAVEKNPNAALNLYRLREEKGWADRVTIVHCDMREWNAPEQADILVSELLGSFGDNELSPECLDGAQRFLKDDGISIPCAYTSYVAPLMSAKLWNEVKASDSLKSFETAYVVRLHNIKLLSQPEPCFTFLHPNIDHPASPWKLLENIRKELKTTGAQSAEPSSSDHTNKDSAATVTMHHRGGYPDTVHASRSNKRYTCMRFVAETSGMIHGVAGYFDSQLYKDVYISIHPKTHSPDMFSWFPIYFPLRTPVYVSKGEVIEFHFWRCVSPSKVWYEWAIGSPDISPVHNPTGRSYWIGLH